MDNASMNFHDAIDSIANMILPKDPHGYDVVTVTNYLGDIARGIKAPDRKTRRNLHDFARWEANIFYPNRKDVDGLRAAVEYLLSTPDGTKLGEVMDEYREHVTNVITDTWDSIRYNVDSENHTGDLWSHLINTMSLVPPDPKLRLMALMHDCAKPTCRHIDPTTSKIIYYEHAFRSGKSVYKQFERLGYPKDECERASYIVSMHDFKPYDDEKSIMRFQARYGDDFQLRDNLLALMEADLLSRKDVNPKMNDKYDAFVRARSKVIEKDERGECQAQVILALNVEQLDASGLNSYAKHYSLLLNHCFNEVLLGNVPNEREELVECARKRAEKIQS